MFADAGSSPTHCERNTFVKPAELAHNGQVKLCGSCEPAAHRTRSHPTANLATVGCCACFIKVGRLRFVGAAIGFPRPVIWSGPPRSQGSRAVKISPLAALGQDDTPSLKKEGTPAPIPGGKAPGRRMPTPHNNERKQNKT